MLPPAKISTFLTQYVKEPRARGAASNEDEDEDEGLELDDLDGMDLDDGAPRQRFKYMRALVRCIFPFPIDEERV